MRDKATLLITFDFPPQATGIGTYLSGIWNNLADKDSHFILAPVYKGSGGFDRASGLKVFRYPGLTGMKAFRTLILLSLGSYFILRKKVNLIFCAVPLSLGFIGWMQKKFFGVSYGIFYYGGEYAKFRPNRFLWPILSVIMKNADFVITISEFSRNESRKFALEPGNILKVTPGVDTDRFAPGIDCSGIRKRLGLEGKRVLLTVARLVKRKGVHLVIDALRKLKNDFPDLVYLVIGRGEEEGDLKKQAKQAGLENDVYFLGYAPEEDLACYYNICDIYIMPNTEVKAADNVEGFGISFIEASACAKPVIAGVSGGVRDAVVDMVTGLLVDPDKSDELTGAIRKLLTDRNFAEGLGRNGRLRVENEFSLSLRAKQIESIINSVAAR